MDNYITANIETLFRQSKMTAEDYFQHASRYLKDCEEYSFDNAMRLAELMAYDFKTSMIALNIQRISESLDKISESMEITREKEE